SVIGAVVTSAFLVIANIAHAQAVNPSTEHGGTVSFADLAEKVAPAVIGVTSKASLTEEESQAVGAGLADQDTPRRARPPPGARRPGNSKPHEAISIGSGFFISADGYAVTNNHVLGDSDTAQIRTHDDRTYSAKVVGRDPLSDLALLKVDG